MKQEAFPINPISRIAQNGPWWGIKLRKLRVPFFDGLYGGRLKANGDYSQAIILDLPSIEGLQAWYTKNEHSEVRR